ncbi:MAG: 7-carboxy-7-deazaguanine synthase QueE [Erythrobacter sp.]|jgi:7-carboxy-7-deazaguanine synthase|uniref:7-carboxy-7-deazaguanine synthase QueE n=1 Tax=Qipengyuania citrea TaxID=225971 RepID=UPI001A3A9824|nr:7-carboxy-7-deazaguanine synthase QueE [Qipengyuania citrea]MBL4717029.1 7-carboxy-7-deazaguanine synthase QueE [Erythrobacter sp.]MCP2017244.1 organic radical activating enzyme [Qipengyuania citrea]MDE0901343.1 7-carboxy-7-deazaguanine synthase QueE [Erythrobacter sp.]
MPLVLATQAPGEPEIFASVQGEGPSAGMPCTFLRLSRCNLACVWCDTAYTWHFAGDERPHRDGVEFDRTANQLTLGEEEVAARITALGQKRLVITGGEPLLQAPALARLLGHLPDVTVEIETNGTTKASPALDIRIDQFNVSPKLAHSGNPAELALIPERLDAYATDPRAWFKFVIAAPADLGEVLALRDRYRFKPDHVFLMPEGTDSETLRAREQWLAPLCVEHGFRMSDRLHIHLFGDTRGT